MSATVDPFLAQCGVAKFHIIVPKLGAAARANMVIHGGVLQSIIEANWAAKSHLLRMRGWDRA